jgi:penicillin-binding protein 1A
LGATSCSLPPVDLEEAKPLALRTTIRAADGSRLARLFKQNRALVPLERAPSHLIDAVLSAEDARYFEHTGWDLKSMIRAALVNLKEGSVVQGGSTITQQYVKNTFFTAPSRTLQRKARELRIAIEVERRYSKQDILEQYLNTVYFGEGAYGIKAASETYFGHGLARLLPEQSALLASLIKSPARYDPREHPRRALMRRNYILDRMAALGKITPKSASRLRRNPIEVTPDPPHVATRQPYFVEAVERELLADRRLGPTEHERARSVWRGGLQIDSTLVPRLQREAENAVASVLDRPGDPSAALVAIRPSTGAIVAMVGGEDWSASQVNLALGREGGGSGRQPGSAFKPIVASTAMEAGIPLSTAYESSPAVFTIPGGEPWVVGNYEGTDYGLMPLDEALIRSVNGVYARLALELGAGQIKSQAKLMGVKAHLPAYPSIALGGAEVSVLDMATAYATLANQGTYVEPTTIASIKLPTGETLRPDQEITQEVVSAGNSYLLTKVLEQVIERGTGVAADIGRPAAGKTGTTNNYADAWFVGYTPQLVAAVWVGYPEGAIPMTSVHGIRVAGGTLPAAIWQSFMTQAHAPWPVKDFRLPTNDLVTVEIDPATGLLAAPWCPGVEKEMLEQLAPTEYCPAPPSPSPEAAPSPEPSPKASPKDADGKDQDEEKKQGGTKAKPSPEPSPTDKPKPSPSPTGKNSSDS